MFVCTHDRTYVRTCTSGAMTLEAGGVTRNLPLRVKKINKG